MMRNMVTAPLLAASFLLAACQQETPATGANSAQIASAGATSIAAPPPIEFQCPVTGTQLTFRPGVTRTALGPDPSDAAVCLQQTQAGAQQRLLYGLIQLPADNDAAFRRGLAALWPLAPGKTSSFPLNFGQYVNTDTWRVERAERRVIAGEPRDLLVLRRTLQSTQFSAVLVHETYWYDIAARAFAKLEVEVVRYPGRFFNSSFEATRIQVP